MLKIAICDDETAALEKLEKGIKRLLPEGEITAFSSGEKLLEEREPFDIYFLDIQMEPMDGIAVAEKLRERDADSVIVFITGTKEYVLKAFDVAALHYLVKPVSDDKLKEALERAVREVERKPGNGKKRLLVRIRDKHIALCTEDICYLENDRRKIIAHTRDENITFYGVMKEMEQKLGSGFYRCHRGYLINLSYVSKYTKDSITMNNGDQVYLSKERYGDFVKRYMRYLRNGGAFHV